MNVYPSADTTAQGQLSKWGNSLAFRVPAELIRDTGLREGDTLQITLSIDGSITIRTKKFNRKQFAEDLDAARVAMPKGTSVIRKLRDERY